MDSTYVTTSGTLLKIRPQKFLVSIRRVNSKAPMMKDTNKVTLTAKNADFGQPAPSSLEILVLLNGDKME